MEQSVEVVMNFNQILYCGGAFSPAVLGSVEFDAQKADAFIKAPGHPNNIVLTSCIWQTLLLAHLDNSVTSVAHYQHNKHTKR